MPDMTITPNEARSQEVYSNVHDLRKEAAKELLSSESYSPEVRARLEKISKKEISV